MALFINEQEITSVFKGSTVISQIYRGIVLVWTGIRSCFGSGFWVNDKSWQNTDNWKN